ncbi:cytoskeletal protein-binding protein SLA1 PWA37_000604 [Arxiozyma heterogenica]|uniref:Actin cytoskeleton-regulatory complex protein SLA1 n=1 Tax=Arxiozyma heterogenica TaxID=278026 RepID=A0AAN8A8B3_9SACH|nr:hypothetical protein RI543_000015 [Kazachstania heterogenica]
MTVFIGIYKAIYSYEPQTTDELAIEENDLLYLLAKSDIDEWWTVKKRLLGTDTEEPTGLVPSNYIEEAPVISHVKALYDYEQPQNPSEELVFHENDTFDVYDDRDPDWILVKSNTSNEYGFVPGNYVEPIGDNTSTVAAAINTNNTTVAVAAATTTTTASTTPATVSNFLPPPQHNARSNYVDSQPFPDSKNNERNSQNNINEAQEEEDIPPPKPMRPVSTMMDNNSGMDSSPKGNRERARSGASYYSGDEDRYYDNSYSQNRRNINTDNYNRHTDDNDEPQDDFYQTWNIQEIDGRKKHKAKLAIGHNKISFIPSKKDSVPQEWTIDKLVSYDHEKKHMFLEFVDPYKNLELHTGSNDKCNEIMTILGEYKGASRGAGLKEIENASQIKKKGKILYDFIAESHDELTVKEGDIVYIVNDKKSPDWWMCENVSTGKRGVIPAQFVERMTGSQNKPERSSSGFFSSFKKVAKGSNSKSPSKAKSSTLGGLNFSVDSGTWKSDANQDISEKKSRSRFNSFSHKKKASSSAASANADSNSSKKTFPDPKKSRIWVDRTGTFKVEAQFIGCADGKIHLHKANGVKIAVAAEKLSEDDLVYVERVTGFSLDKFKPNVNNNTTTSGLSSSKDAREQERERRRRIREKEEKERDRMLRERELMELKKARELLDEERQRLQQQKELPPAKPPRPDVSNNVDRRSSTRRTSSNTKTNNYDWFEFFLNCGVDVSNCQRYTINFDREQITEDMQADINSSMLRTLGLREGDIVRVMKYLDNKFGRENQPAPTGNMFTQPDGSLKDNTGSQLSNNISHQVQPQLTAPATQPPTNIVDDDSWTARPASKSQPNLVVSNNEFTGSVQELLDLEPLTPKKAAQATSVNYATESTVPAPKLDNLESVKSTSDSTQASHITSTLTGGPAILPLDPFKTGGNNILPISTSFVMMPFITGGVMPLQKTGGMSIPQTTFGAQLTGGVLPVQKTANGLIPITTTGGTMPQTTFGTQVTGGLMPLQTTGGFSGIPNTSFGLPPVGSVLPVQKTGSGIIPASTTGGAMLPLQVTGGAVPQTSFMTQSITGNVNGVPQTSFGNQITGGTNIIPTTSFINQMTGGANVMPTTGFGNQLTGGANIMPQTSLAGMQTTGDAMPLQRTGGFQPQSKFGIALQQTGGLAPLSQNQWTGGVMQQPQFVNNQIGSLAQGLQKTSISQTPTIATQQPMLQTQPTGFGFGNGPQLSQQPQQRQANIMNASAANPFGFS